MKIIPFYFLFLFLWGDDYKNEHFFKIGGERMKKCTFLIDKGATIIDIWGGGLEFLSDHFLLFHKGY